MYISDIQDKYTIYKIDTFQPYKINNKINIKRKDQI